MATFLVISNFYIVKDNQNTTLIFRFYAVTHERGLKIYKTPGHVKQFNGDFLFKVFTGAYDDTTCLNWSSDSKYISFLMALISYDFSGLP